MAMLNNQMVIEVNKMFPCFLPKLTNSRGSTRRENKFVYSVKNTFLHVEDSEEEQVRYRLRKLGRPPNYHFDRKKTWRILYFQTTDIKKKHLPSNHVYIHIYIYIYMDLHSIWRISHFLRPRGTNRPVMKEGAKGPSSFCLHWLKSTQSS